MLCRLCLRVIIVRRFRGKGIERVAKIEHYIVQLGYQHGGYGVGALSFIRRRTRAMIALGAPAR